MLSVWCKLRSKHGVMIKWGGVCGNIYNIVIFHLPAVVWTTRWAIVKNSSAIAKISSELVEISSELVEISSELVWISSELVLSNSELLIIGVYRKTSKLVTRTLFSLWNEGRGELFIFVLIYLYIKSALYARSSEMFFGSKWLEIILCGIGKAYVKKIGSYLECSLRPWFVAEV